MPPQLSLCRRDGADARCPSNRGQRWKRPAEPYPVDNATYNLMQALASKLEAIEAYGRYAQDEGGEIFRELAEEERGHAERLLEQLRDRIRA